MTDQDNTTNPLVEPPKDNISGGANQISQQQTTNQSSNPPPPPWVQESEPLNPPAVQSPAESTVSTEPPQTVISPPPAVMPSPAEVEPAADEPFAPPPPPPASFSTSSLADMGGKNNLLKKLLPILLIVSIASLILFISLKVILPRIKNLSSSGSGSEANSKNTTKTKANLTYWGLWEPDTMLAQIIADYQQAHPEVAITYAQKSPKDYRERLQSSLVSGEGPDIFRFHNTWAPMLKTELDTVPKGAINLEEYFPVVARDLQVGTETVGIPLMFDSLALYYNTRLFKEAGKTVPASWSEVRKTALDMCVAETETRECMPGAKISTAGIALGTTNNVDNFSDILGLMILQNNADPAKPTDLLAEDALKFYTLFSTVDGVWDETLPASTYAFATEKVAMMLAPSWRVFDIKEINPDLKFQTAPAPQLPGTNISWASYWVEGVSRRSKYSKEAWEFLQYLSSNEVLTKMYTAQSNTRLFGELYPKKSLAKELESDSVAGAFVKQGEIAKSWYLASRTFDNGINDRIIKYYEDAVNAVLEGKMPTEALKPTASGISQILSQYGITIQ